MDLDSSAEAPDPSPLSIQEPYFLALYEKICAPSQAPKMNAGCSDHLSYDQLPDLCDQHGYHRKDSKAALMVRLASTHERNSRSAQENQGNKNIPLTDTGKRERGAAAGHQRGPTCVLGKRCKRDSFRVAFGADMGAANEHAQLRNPELEPQVEAPRSSAAYGVEPAITAWVADECNRVSGKK